MQYGLIGEKLGHSFSKIIHEKLADYTYDLHPLPKQELASFLEKKEFRAINVTIPYKIDVMPYLYEIDQRAQAVGSVNTIVNRNGNLYGYNTDFGGFLYLLKHNNIDVLKQLLLFYIIYKQNRLLRFIINKAMMLLHMNNAKNYIMMQMSL